ncbi:predicted protein [Naegleria gruberi]|uniref:Predicted protein n=1 Tax=Naegleria gruberi TaxID=5762 RepID=D2W0M5_NAEGR|nr:uncharacterized protein NAEGRDRAFT_74911 [Naegleria gruberi]EFC37363.1 predicted protein [Naegleria gruberi]|eukprot:XP_002670107.1 predicted protein [Naegleria gruberi strain NEG-M]
MSTATPNLQGYQTNLNKLAEVSFPFGSENIRQAIYCPYPDKTLIVAAKAMNQQQPYQTKIVVADFSFNDDDPLAMQVNISIVNEYQLNIEGALYTIPVLFPLKKEKCFLTIINIAGKRELRKIDIESGDIVWIKPGVETDTIVEDDRGILFYFSYDGYLTLMDSVTGFILDKIRVKMRMFNGIGWDVNDNLIVGGYDSKYLYFTRVFTKNGKVVKKKTNYAYLTFTTKVDRYNRKTYIHSNNSQCLTTFDVEGRLIENVQFGNSTSLCGFFFLKDCKYMMIFLESSLAIYD